MPIGVGTNRIGALNSSMFFLIIFSLLPSQFLAEVYDISSSNPLADGDYLVSPSQVFELGFFSLNNSANKYVGLWHKSIFPRKVLWVANRETPLAAIDTLASLRIGSNGNLELIDGAQNFVWSTNVSVSSDRSSAVLLDTGNFVLRDEAEVDLWESFNYPCDTLLPNQRLGYSKSGKRQFLTSWRSQTDASSGNYSIGLTSETPSQVFIWMNGSTPYWRSGPWDKSKFIGIPTMDDLYQSGYSLDDDKYFSYSFSDYPISYISISSEGIVDLMLSDSGKNWFLNWEAPYSLCDSYGVCGPFGVCKDSELHICKCLEGYVPKSNDEWSRGNWTGGCVRQTKLFCDSETSKSVSSRTKKNDDGFWKIMRVKVPDSHELIPTPLDAEDTLDDCKVRCLNNCSCLAYAFVNKIGCLAWSKDLIDIQQFPAYGVDLYIRLAHSELGDERKPIKLIASLTAIGSMSILVVIVFSLHRWRASKGELALTARRLESTSIFKIQRDGFREYIGKRDSSELKIYDFDSILIATDSFSIKNKLGQGGFGPVYKGILSDGKEVAVKRLSSSSGQGVEEFKNEMLLISNLQHKNLVRMMGCCVNDDEKLLIYEFMPNQSLDTFLFDPTKRAVLDWATRFNIIQGVARGLLYLHHDSYVKVIHRDLKVSNILLDEKMNPKISDFGLARIVEETESLDNTHRVVGTRGYMSPEYAMGGIFSEKSDVYSFGVLLLEIISGKKNTSFYLYDQQLGLLAYVWNLWNEGRTIELVDEVLGDSYISSEVHTCVHVGLLCVQDNAADRPTMVDVASILNSEKDGPQPKLPQFTIQNSVSHPGQHNETTNSSRNEASITMIEGR